MSANSAAVAPVPLRRSTVRIAVVGDRGTGKSSLIAAVASENFPESVSPVLPPTRLPADYYPDGVPVTIIDTASSLEGKAKVDEELKRADAVVLTYAYDRPETLNRHQSFWIPEVRRLKVKAPLIVVGCKLDLRDEHSPVSLEQVMAPIMQRFREIETCIECSAANLVQVPEMFYYAQKAVLHPTAPLFDQESQTLEPRCIRALKRIFILCDHDMDSALNDKELNEFQVKCFNAPLQPAESVGVKRAVQERVPEGVNDLGLTLTGFLFLHALFIEKGRLETTWTVLRKFGYNDDIELCKENLPVLSKKDPDQSVELTSEAVDFLTRIYGLFDSNNDGVLQDSELDEVFSIALESPCDEAPYKNSLERTELGDIGLSGFLSQWALMTMLDPAKSLACLIYLGYTDDPATALRVTRKRTLDVKKQQSDRHVFQCFVFGPKNSGKSSLLSSFVGRPFQNSQGLTGNQSYTVNAVFRELRRLLYSLKRASELLMDVARRGEDTGYGVPCLFIGLKDDLDSYPMAIRDSEAICQEMNIDGPIRISVNKRVMNNFFWRIVNAAEHCHLSVPETEYRRNMKRYRRLVNLSILMLASVGAAAAVIALGFVFCSNWRKRLQVIILISRFSGAFDL